MIAIGSDHGGFDLKEQVKKHLEERGFEVKDFGCYDKSSVDYPDFGIAAAKAVAAGECEKGIGGRARCSARAVGERLTARLLPVRGVDAIPWRETSSAPIAGRRYPQVRSCV